MKTPITISIELNHKKWIQKQTKGWLSKKVDQIIKNEINKKGIENPQKHTTLLSSKRGDKC